MRATRLDDAPLDLGQLFERLNVGKTEVVALANVGDDGYIAALKARSFAKDAAACCFKHGRVDIGDSSGSSLATLRAAAIAFVDTPPGYIHTFGACHADTSAEPCQNVRNQARCSSLTIDTRDGDDRNAAGSGHSGNSARRSPRPPALECRSRAEDASASRAGR